MDGMTSDLETELRRNLELRHELGIEIDKVRESSGYRFAVGKPEDQPLILAVLIILIALTLWYFL
jgi:hypothetical protein